MNCNNKFIKFNTSKKNYVHSSLIKQENSIIGTTCLGGDDKIGDEQKRSSTYLKRRNHLKSNKNIASIKISHPVEDNSFQNIDQDNSIPANLYLNTPDSPRRKSVRNSKDDFYLQSITEHSTSSNKNISKYSLNHAENIAQEYALTPKKGSICSISKPPSTSKKSNRPTIQKIDNNNTNKSKRTNSANSKNLCKYSYSDTKAKIPRYPNQLQTTSKLNLSVKDNNQPSEKKSILTNQFQTDSDNTIPTTIPIELAPKTPKEVQKIITNELNNPSIDK